MNKFKAPRSLADLQRLLNLLETKEDLRLFREDVVAIQPYGQVFGPISVVGEIFTNISRAHFVYPYFVDGKLKIILSSKMIPSHLNFEEAMSKVKSYITKTYVSPATNYGEGSETIELYITETRIKKKQILPQATKKEINLKQHVKIPKSLGADIFQAPLRQVRVFQQYRTKENMATLLELEFYKHEMHPQDMYAVGFIFRNNVVIWLAKKTIAKNLEKHPEIDRLLQQTFNKLLRSGNVIFVLDEENLYELSTRTQLTSHEAFVMDPKKALSKNIHNKPDEAFLILPEEFRYIYEDNMLEKLQKELYDKYTIQALTRPALNPATLTIIYNLTRVKATELKDVFMKIIRATDYFRDIDSQALHAGIITKNNVVYLQLWPHASKIITVGNEERNVTYGLPLNIHYEKSYDQFVHFLRMNNNKYLIYRRGLMKIAADEQHVYGRVMDIMRLFSDMEIDIYINGKRLESLLDVPNEPQKIKIPVVKYIQPNLKSRA